MSLIDRAYPALAALTEQLLSRWPGHQRALEASFAHRDASDLAHADRLSQMVMRLSQAIEGGLPAVLEGYRFICDIVLKEELHFRRRGTYRLSKFEDADRLVYSDKVFMTKYMNGLLASSVFWVNHCRAFQNFSETFLPMVKENGALLEIGPGHGLLLYLATRAAQVKSVAGWDVSRTSLELSRHALAALGAARPVTLEEHNIFEPSIMAPEFAGRFDAIVFSEVLEHLEEPAKALEVLFHLCAPGGLVWINVPANSPAPDHLYLINAPSEAVALVRNAGFEIGGSHAYPMNDLALDYAVKNALTISCIVVGRKPA
ncbi:MAG TPA: class I SAM-dependent methyltransferase [Rhizomicrobium sp.]|jgi:2-polyprenyl-3-methyl-5-hydroxy-6-metoxy-1,4-benzoquinol methylase